MAKSYDDIIEEVQADYEPEDYEVYEDFISEVQEEYGVVAESINEQLEDWYIENKEFLEEDIGNI